MIIQHFNLSKLFSRPGLILIVFFINWQPINAQLIINISNIKEIKGRIELGIYDNPDVFLSETEQYKVLYILVDSTTVSISLDSIPKGRYAISLMQDLNSNGEMEKNFLGIPKEPYGFSNNYRPILSKPDFEDADFYYNGRFLKLTIALIH